MSSYYPWPSPCLLEGISSRLCGCPLQGPARPPGPWSRCVHTGHWPGCELSPPWAGNSVCSRAAPLLRGSGMHCSCPLGSLSKGRSWGGGSRRQSRLRTEWPPSARLVCPWAATPSASHLEPGCLFSPLCSSPH
jgi:hypothetical protein